MAIHFKRGPGQPTWGTAVAQGVPQVSNPLGAANKSHYVVEQLYMQLLANYTRPADNALCDLEGLPFTAANAIFCDDSPRIPLGAGLCTFTRTWATKPSSMTEYDEAILQMPARAAVRWERQSPGGISSDDYIRTPYLFAKGYSRPARLHILRTFWLIGSTTESDYASPTDIPTNNESTYSVADVTARGEGPFGKTDWDALIASDQNIGNFSGCIRAPSPLTNPSLAIGATLTRYATELSSGNYWVGQSKLIRYLGNIWERRSSRVVL